MSVDISYVSTSCNQTVNIADWGKNNLICYGSCNVVLIYDLTIGGGKVIQTLHGHSKRVNAVRWITGGNFETELVSVSTDGNAIVWSLKGDTSTHVVLKGHTGIVNVVDALYRNVEQKHSVVATASADSTARIWNRANENDDFVCTQTINFDYNICLALRLTMLQKTNSLLMACALDTSSINLYLEKENTFDKLSVLKGHDDWVRGLDFTVNDVDGIIMLASSSQDAFIRLWKIAPTKNQVAENTEKIYVHQNEILINDEAYDITVESILAGHEGWVYAVSWNSDGTKLLSASLDKSMIIWELNLETDLWLENMRVGEVGGNTLGFYGGMFGPDENKIMAHSYHGAFHIWNLNNHMWEPQVTIGGHFSEVIDLAWDPQGEYVMSVSYDQTNRVHAPWRKNNGDIITWHEIGRPQVHGYDMSCVAIISRYKFASAAEEKIIRTFEAPENFVKNFRRICNIQDDIEYTAPRGASVPSLGLSNKAVYQNDNSDKAKIKNSKDMYAEESYFTSIDMTEPPTEENLIQNTLWPEIQKLYGHGYEVYSLTSSSDGKLLASACKSTTPEHSAILLWETETSQIIQKLYSHTLTIAQLSFSPDCQHLLSVSRDRRWSLFTRNSESKQFELAATTDKKTGLHTRIIWTCAWSHDSKHFATGSRDGKLVVWRKDEDKLKENVLGQYEAASKALELKGESITAVAFSPICLGDQYLIAVGLDNGFIYLYRWSKDGFKQVLKLDHTSAHHLTVKKLVFRPVLGEAGCKVRENDILQLASCSSDHSVRIYTIHLSKL